MTREDIRDIEIEIESKTVRTAGKERTTLVLAVEGDDDEEWVDIAQDTVDKLRTAEGIHRTNGDEAGDVLTLGDLLDRNGLSADDLERERRLREFDVLDDLDIGDIVEVTRLRNGEPKEPSRGVVRAQKPGDKRIEDRAEIAFPGDGWSALENADGDLRIGRMSQMGPIYDIETVSPDEVNEELRQTRESVLESAEIDDESAAYDVTVEKKWEESSKGTEGGTDLHARVTVSGPDLGEPATVHCRNLFDVGWTANVEDDVDEDLEEVVIRAARNNSPIPTGVRL